MIARARGLTLVETMVALTLLSGILLLVAQSTRATYSAYDTVSGETRLTRNVRKGADAAAVELQMGGNLTIAVDQVYGSDMVTYQQAISVGESGPTWGASGQSGWWLRLTVNAQRQLVRQVLDSTMTLVSETVLASQLENPLPGQKALTVSLSGIQLTMTLVTRHQNADHDLTRSVTTDVTIRTSTQ